MNEKDLVFLSETHANVKSLDAVPNFELFGDPSFPLFQNHGGQVVLVSSVYAQYITDLRFTKCTISFSLSVVPDVFFMGVYVYPPSSPNHKDTDFAIVINEIDYWMSKGYTPYVGGDFNSRIGDIGAIASRSLKWKFEDNIDKGANGNKSSFKDMCEVTNILPLNHCVYNKKKFAGGFTYFKGGKKSQIDFVLTNNVGRRNIEEFTMVTEGWHFSDHIPLDMQSRLCYDISALSLLLRSKSLIELTQPKRNNCLKTFKNDFDFNAAKFIMEANAVNIARDCTSLSADFIVQRLHAEMGDAIKRTAKPSKRYNPNLDTSAMDDCDESFNKYLTELNKGNNDTLPELYNDYQEKRNKLNAELFTKSDKKYKSVIDCKDSKRLWGMINWKGDMSSPSNHPPIEELSEHFCSLYEPIQDDGDLQSLDCDTYIPETDDPIDANELKEACNQVKKGGYDFSAMSLLLILSTIGVVLLLLMNTMLSTGFPSRLRTSLLTALPKSGNLRLSDNYRGIQMLPLLAVVFDRIICNRLIKWAKINFEQTAFQTGKGTIDQIFLVRVIISLMKVSGKVLYVGFFDLSKAFDRVSRYLLLKQLLKLGVGSVLFYALKSVYSVTRCVLKGFGKISEVFETHTGIKQGASSSVILFIIFMDDIIDKLKENCLIEPILNDLHSLLHADDTIILSTNRELFIHKCNVLVDIIKEKKMSLNYKKSGYFIINGTAEDIKCNLKLNSGWLKYNGVQKYLGAIFTDTGSLHNDIGIFLKKKTKEVNVKLARFLVKNEYAPLSVKLQVVDACINSALLYSCEAWGSCPLQSIEVLQRKALKMVLDVSKNTPNEVVYIESGLQSLKSSIYKRQLKFFQKVKKDSIENPTSPISVIIQQALDENTQYLRHYKKLEREFLSPERCFDHHVNEHKQQVRQKVQQKFESDPDSLLGTYCRVNPELQEPAFNKNVSCHEIDRKVITRYRTGCHKLKIQTGRLAGDGRDTRLCSCGTDIQTLAHVLFFCPLTANIRQMHQFNSTNLECFFKDTDYTKCAAVLKSVAKVLKL